MIPIATTPLLLMVADVPRHLRFSAKGARLRSGTGVYRSVLAASVPKPLQGALGARVNLYERSGKVCTGVAREFVFVNQGEEDSTEYVEPPKPAPPPVQVLSPGDFLPREPEPLPGPVAAVKKDPPISVKMWSTRPKPADEYSPEGRSLTLRVEPEPGCAADKLQWGRLAAWPSPEVYVTVPVDGALKKLVTDEALRLFAKTLTNEDFRESATFDVPSDPCAHCAPFKLWHDFVRKNLGISLFRGAQTGRQIVAATAGFRRNGACDQVGNFALFERQTSPVALRRLGPVDQDPTAVRAMVDLDGDGWPELILEDGRLATYIDGTVVLFSNGGRYNRRESYTITRDCEE